MRKEGTAIKKKVPQPVHRVYSIVNMNDELADDNLPLGAEAQHPDGETATITATNIDDRDATINDEDELTTNDVNNRLRRRRSSLAARAELVMIRQKSVVDLDPLEFGQQQQQDKRDSLLLAFSSSHLPMVEHKRHRFATESQQDQSFQSDASSLSASSLSSLETLLESRREDPEQILLNLGFGGTAEPLDPLARIPNRFLRPSKVKGNSLEEFVRHQEEVLETLDSGFFGYRGLQGFLKDNRQPVGIVGKILKKMKENDRDIRRASSTSSPGGNLTSFADVAFSVMAVNSFRHALMRNHNQNPTSILEPANREFLDVQPKEDSENRRVILGGDAFLVENDGSLVHSGKVDEADLDQSALQGRRRRSTLIADDEDEIAAEVAEVLTATESVNEVTDAVKEVTLPPPACSKVMKMPKVDVQVGKRKLWGLCKQQVCRTEPPPMIPNPSEHPSVVLNSGEQPSMVNDPGKPANRSPKERRKSFLRQISLHSEPGHEHEPELPSETNKLQVYKESFELEELSLSQEAADEDELNNNNNNVLYNNNITAMGVDLPDASKDGVRIGSALSDSSGFLDGEVFDLDSSGHFSKDGIHSALPDCQLDLSDNYVTNTEQMKGVEMSQAYQPQEVSSKMEEQLRSHLNEVEGSGKEAASSAYASESPLRKSEAIAEYPTVKNHCSNPPVSSKVLLSFLPASSDRAKKQHRLERSTSLNQRSTAEDCTSELTGLNIVTTFNQDNSNSCLHSTTRGIACRRRRHTLSAGQSNAVMRAVQTPADPEELYEKVVSSQTIDAQAIDEVYDEYSEMVAMLAVMSKGEVTPCLTRNEFFRKTSEERTAIEGEALLLALEKYEKTLTGDSMALDRYRDLSEHLSPKDRSELRLLSELRQGICKEAATMRKLLANKLEDLAKLKCCKDPAGEAGGKNIRPWERRHRLVTNFSVNLIRQMSLLLHQQNSLCKHLETTHAHLGPRVKADDSSKQLALTTPSSATRTRDSEQLEDVARCYSLLHQRMVQLFQRLQDSVVRQVQEVVREENQIVQQELQSNREELQEMKVLLRSLVKQKVNLEQPKSQPDSETVGRKDDGVIS